MSVTGKVAEGVGNTLGNVFGGVTSVVKDAMAANNAHAANENLQDAKDAANGKVHGVLYRAGEELGDKVADTVNIATLGLSRRVGNVFDDKASKIDYKALKDAKTSNELDRKSSVADRSVFLVNDEVVDLASDEEGPTGP